MSKSASPPRVVVYAEGTTLDVENLVGSGVTHLILSFVHIGDDGLPQSFGLAPDNHGYYLVYNSSQLYSTSDYQAYVAPLDQGTIPSALLSAVDQALVAAGRPKLSSQLTVNILDAGQRWAVQDGSNQYLYRFQLFTNEEGQTELQFWDPEWVGEAQLVSFWSDVVTIQQSGIAVLVSMGGGGVSGDWLNLAAATDTVVSLFTDFLSQRGIVGVDLDVEAETNDATADACVAFMTALSKSSPAPLFTAAPYSVTWSWFLGLAADASTGSGNLFTWWNVQMYEGSDNDSSSTSGGTYQGYVTDIHDAKAGITDGVSFLVPGWNADPSASPLYDPSTMTAALKNVRQTVDAAPSGAFVWKLSYLTGAEQTWAQAIVDGLS